MCRVWGRPEAQPGGSTCARPATLPCGEEPCLNSMTSSFSFATLTGQVTHPEMRPHGSGTVQSLRGVPEEGQGRVLAVLSPPILLPPTGFLHAPVLTTVPVSLMQGAPEGCRGSGMPSLVCSVQVKAKEWSAHRALSGVLWRWGFARGRRQTPLCLQPTAPNLHEGNKKIKSRFPFLPSTQTTAFRVNCLIFFSARFCG